jgi:hypothetical protein
MKLALDHAVSSRAVDSDGRLRVLSAPISKAGICEYLGKEIPGFRRLGLAPGRTYRMLRHPEELRRAAPTFNGLPLLSEHVPLNEPHRPELTIGALGTDAKFMDPYLLCSITVWAQAALDAIESGERAQLSSCYRYTADMTPGVFQGQQYDGVMRNIEGHHVSTVNRGRAGSDVGFDRARLDRRTNLNGGRHGKRFAIA